jgi:hypothetical protein
VSQGITLEELHEQVSILLAEITALREKLSTGHCHCSPGVPAWLGDYPAVHPPGTIPVAYHPQAIT